MIKYYSIISWYFSLFHNKLVAPALEKSSLLKKLYEWNLATLYFSMMILNCYSIPSSSRMFIIPMSWFQRDFLHVSGEGGIAHWRQRIYQWPEVNPPEAGSGTTSEKRSTPRSRYRTKQGKHAVMSHRNLQKRKRNSLFEVRFLWKVFFFARSSQLLRQFRKEKKKRLVLKLLKLHNFQRQTI